ncbi:Atu4866 domain-containing protein [Ideonella azotifigens]|nr:Atu4866 domain-containing protein [Ideonella azotifigens]MCD2339530.1 Atu4866 domain-containing protein [Ideonella azotifigens]
MKRETSTYGITVLLSVASAVMWAAPDAAWAARGNSSEPQSTGSTMSTTATQSHSAKTERHDSHPYAGMWVTADGYIRHELLSNGRYDEARGKRQSAYQGRYRVTGNHIDYVDDTGFTADGEFRDGVLHHAGMVLYREDKRD